MRHVHLKSLAGKRACGWSDLQITGSRPESSDLWSVDNEHQADHAEQADHQRVYCAMNQNSWIWVSVGQNASQRAAN